MVKRLQKRPRPVLPKLYSALFEISALHDELLDLRELHDADAAHYLARLEDLQGKAHRLTEHFEIRQGVFVH